MNPYDKDNLNFFLNSTPETIALWYSQATTEDLSYVDNLLSTAELDFAILIEEEVFTDFTLADSVISKFRL